VLPGGNANGYVHVHYGSPNGPSVAPGWISVGPTLSNYGVGLATANVNGDAYPDLIVGADRYLDTVVPGEVYVYHGSAAGLASPPSANRVLSGPHAGDLFGYPVANAGDTNMDGYEDVIVGAAYYTSGQFQEGRFSVYRGSATGLSAAPIWSAESNDAGALLGYAVSGAGDVNMDGYDDVIVGAAYANNGQTDEGRAWVYLGSGSNDPSTAFTTGASWQIEGNENFAYLGISVAGVGDVNMDGYDDVVVGASGFDGAGGFDSGRVHLLHGSASGLVAAPGWPRDGSELGAAFGYSAAGAGDVNGDGRPDVLIGAVYEDGGASNAGRVHLHLGEPSGLATTAARVMQPNQAGSLLGFIVGGAGDVNMDGYADMLAGGYSFNGTIADEGAQFLYYGGDQQALEYTVRRLVGFNGTSYGGAQFGSAALNARGDVLFATTAFGNDYVALLPRGALADVLPFDVDDAIVDVATDFDANNFAYIWFEGFNDDGTALLSGWRDSSNLYFLAIWNRRFGLHFVVPDDASSLAFPVPDLNEAGDVVFLQGGQIRRYRNYALEPALAPCASFAYEVQTNDANQLAFGCGAGSAAQLFLGTASPFPAVVDQSSFSPPSPGPYHPRGLNDSGKLVIQRGDGAIFTRSGGTLSEILPLHLAASTTVNDAGGVAGYAGNSVIVGSTPAHRVVGIGDTIGSATITYLFQASDGFNDHGQFAFFAMTSDPNEGATEGLYLATPFACDSDRDGWCDANDNCPSRPDFEQPDLDHDGVGDLCDNCPLAWNADQTDNDMDGRGDACGACGSSGPNTPFCESLNVTTPGQIFTRTVSLDSLPERPVIVARATSATPGLSADFTLGSCVGGTPHPFANCDEFNPWTVTGTGGRLRAGVYQCYLADANRNGATCTLTVTATGGTGSLALLVDGATNPPLPVDGVTNPGAPLLVTPDEIPFVQEGHDYRFLDGGTGGSSFGTCSFATPEPTDFMEINYSAAPGPGWDCCTFQYEGVDDVLSDVGQVVVSVNGAPPPPDTDMDGFLNPCDHCPYVADDASDSGGVNSTLSDGIADACQCGDLTHNGVVDGLDVARLRNILAGVGPAASPAELAMCAVVSPSTACNLRTLVHLRRGVAVPPRYVLAQTCTNALPPGS
jgi:hypothetical protein